MVGKAVKFAMIEILAWNSLMMKIGNPAPKELIWNGNLIFRLKRVLKPGLLIGGTAMTAVKDQIENVRKIIEMNL